MSLLVMLWTAPPAARKCQRCGCCLRLPRFGGAKHASDYDDRFRHRQVSLSEHGVDAAGQVTRATNNEMRRFFMGYRCVVGGSRLVAITIEAYLDAPRR